MRSEINKFQSDSNFPVLQKIKLKEGRIAEGHCTMDKALACYAGSQGSNRIIPKILVLQLSQVPPPCALSLTMPVVTCSSVNTCHVQGKK